MTTNRRGIDERSWRVECSQRAEHELDMADVNECLLRHLFLVDRSLQTAEEPAPQRLARAVGYDRHGCEFWILSVFETQSTLIALPEEVREAMADA